MPSRSILSVGSSDCFHSAALIRMSVFLVCPGLAGFQGVFSFKIGKALNGFSLFPREFEIDVLELVVKTDLTGIRESCAEIHPINSRPIDGAHAHRTRSSIDVDIT